MAGNDHPDFSKPVMVAGTARAAQSARGRKGEQTAISKKPRKPKQDETREERISMAIVTDAHDEGERAMG